MAGKGTIQAERLKSLIERIERLEEERAALTGDIREVYAEAKSAGYDTKVMRQIVRLRRMDAADRQEQEALLDVPFILFARPMTAQGTRRHEYFWGNFRDANETKAMLLENFANSREQIIVTAAIMPPNTW
jgi:uncharacterized protein (UPF0335 family)